MAVEKTLSIIKPDAVARKLQGEILSRIHQAGFRIVAIKTMILSQGEAAGFYAIHRERPFFGELTGFMSSGKIFAMVLEAEGGILKPETADSWEAGFKGALADGRFDWNRAMGIAGQTIKIAAAVGSLATIFVPGASAIVVGNFVVPAKALALMKAGGSAVTIVEAAKKIFLDNDEANSAVRKRNAKTLPRGNVSTSITQRSKPLSRRARNGTTGFYRVKLPCIYLPNSKVFA